mgnify:CR=1 FL=1
MTQLRWIRWTALGLALAATCAWAKVSPTEAERLGKDLTCMGAIKAGNKDGSIPEFSGKWLGTPPGIPYKPHVGEFSPDPYANEKPLFVITVANMAQYASKLSEGEKAMFKKYPKTFRMPIYPSHRDFRYEDAVCEVAKKNALEAEVTNNGLAVKGFKGAIPFPIPKTGIEAAWNMIMPHRAWTEEIDRDTAVVGPDGKIVWSRTQNTNLVPINDPKAMGQPLTDGVGAYALLSVQKPEREKGTVLTAMEPTSYYKDKRLAWIYDPGTRRVRQLPEFGFDQPMAGVNGRMTIDSDRLFNGSPERYDWKILGKKEIYVPIDTYKVNGRLKYEDLLKPENANPDYMRYELRRVWVVEAVLKSGFRHLYAKRINYVDEDTWHILLADYYDGRGELWRTAVANYYYAYDMKAWEIGVSFFYELSSGSYIAYNLFQEMPKAPILDRGGLRPAQFSPESLRSLGN